MSFIAIPVSRRILAKAGLKAPGGMGQTEENNWVIHGGRRV
jgi:hypothetical protein